MKAALAALLLASLTSGCAALDRVNDALVSTGAFDLEPSAARELPKDCVVPVLAGDRRGRGAVTGPRTVLTVAHVIGDATEVEVGTSSIRWGKARVARRIAATPEDMIELEVELAPGFLGFEGFPEGRQVSVALGVEPAFVLASSGTRAWPRGRNLRHGDSGSPVLSRDGALVGLLVGKTTGGEAVLARAQAPRRDTLLALSTRR